MLEAIGIGRKLGVGALSGALVVQGSSAFAADTTALATQFQKNLAQRVIVGACVGQDAGGGDCSCGRSCDRGGQQCGGCRRRHTDAYTHAYSDSDANHHGDHGDHGNSSNDRDDCNQLAFA